MAVLFWRGMVLKGGAKTHLSCQTLADLRLITSGHAQFFPRLEYRASTILYLLLVCTFHADSGTGKVKKKKKRGQGVGLVCWVMPQKILQRTSCLRVKLPYL